MLFFTSFLVSFLSTPLILYLGLRFGALDDHGFGEERPRPVVCLGGLSVVLGLVTSGGVFLYTTGDPLTYEIGVIVIGSMVVLFGGYMDDLTDIRVFPKLSWQFLAASIPLLLGFESLFPAPWFSSFDHFSLNSVIFLVAATWIVGVTNAVDISDGLDGLAPGLVAISATLIALLAYHQGLTQTALFCGGLAAAVIGFLPFNIHPAQIFLGHTGCLFAGYLLGELSVSVLQGYPLVLSLCVLPWLVGIPVMDTLYAMLRRAAAGRSITESDRSHIHHRLRFQRGFGYAKTVYFLWSMNALMGTVALALVRLPWVYALALLSLCSILVPIPIFLRETVRGVFLCFRRDSKRERTQSLDSIAVTRLTRPSSHINTNVQPESTTE